MTTRALESTTKGCGQRLLTVSNRGPMEYHLDADGKVVAVPGQGGLSTALSAAASLYPTTWLSSPLTAVDRQIAAGKLEIDTSKGVAHFVATEPEAYELFYGSFSNEALWLLQHTLPWPEELTSEQRLIAWRKGYVAVNRAFAEAVVEELDAGGVGAVMFHDYHFYLAPLFVREQLPHAYLQHFIHIPWPAAAEWTRLEDGIVESICRGLLANDSLIFQTPESAENFRETCAAFLPDAVVDEDTGTVRLENRVTRVWADGISVDPEELETAALTAEFNHYRYTLRADPGQKTIIRVDRLDPTKNVIRGFQAYERLLEDHPELHEHVYFLALLVPTKTEVASYRRYQDETHELADAINRRFGNHRWKPIKVMFEHNRTQALAAMSLYDLLLVNPIADGMNLVAKEGPMLNTRDGVLVLSKTAGAYAELADGVLPLDPEDIEGTAAALYKGLTLDPLTRRQMVNEIRDRVRSHSLRDWFQDLLGDIELNAAFARKAPAA